MDPAPNSSFYSSVLKPMAVFLFASIVGGIFAGATVILLQNYLSRTSASVTQMTPASPAANILVPDTQTRPIPVAHTITAAPQVDSSTGTDVYHLIYELPREFVAYTLSINQNFDRDRPRSNPSCHWEGTRAGGRRFECDMAITHGQTAGFEVQFIPNLSRTASAHILHLYACEPDDFGNPIHYGTFGATRNGQLINLVPTNLGTTVHPTCYFLDPSTPCPYSMVRLNDHQCIEQTL